MRIRTAAQAKAVKTPGRHSAGGHGLYLNVTEGGGKSWVQCLTVDGKRRNIGLGSFDLVTLQEAQDLAHENRKKARQGGDPLAERRKAQGPAMMPEQILLTRQQVEQLISMSRSQIYHLVKLGKFPEPVKITDGPKGAVRWRKDEILAWLETRPRTGRRPDLPEYQPGQAAQKAPGPWNPWRDEQ